MRRLTLLLAADRTNNQRPIIRRPNEASSDTLIRERTAKSGRVRPADAASILHRRRNSVRFIHTIAAASLAAAALVAPASAADISGAGATFPYPIYAKWADTYKRETGIGLNYQSIGSGGGLKQIKAKTATFGP